MFSPRAIVRNFHATISAPNAIISSSTSHHH